MVATLLVALVVWAIVLGVQQGNDKKHSALAPVAAVSRR